MSKKLKPCPFCGKIPQLIDAGTYYYVACFNTLCKISPCTSEKNTPKEAINSWNTRAKNINISGGLKSCPMCGCEANLIEYSSGVYSVICSNDECCTAEKEDYSDKQDAFDAWNTRANKNA